VAAVVQLPAIQVVLLFLVAPNNLTENFIIGNKAMNILSNSRKMFIFFIATLTSFMFCSQSLFALTIGEAYTISIEKINSNGTLTSGGTSLGISTTATADSDGKLAFSFTSSIPNNSSCNFMVVTITNSSDAVVRRTVVPCPDSGKALSLGVSGVTNKQADAMIAAFSSAGNDDPILATFGFIMIRSEGISASEIVFMANLANQGINATNGYVDDMTNKGVTTAQILAYRNAIISKLADPDTGYAKLMKDSVDVASSGDSTLEAAKRGEASAKLFSFLVESATTAGFSIDRVLEAFNAMGAIVVPLMATAVADGDLTAATKQSIDSSVGGGIQKLKADRDIEKYTQALSSLGASGADLSTFTSAAATLATSMSTAFKTFDEVFTGSETDTEVATADSTFQASMQTAFSAFITATAASNGRLTTMIANIDSALGASTGLSTSEFQYYKSDSTTVNWPIMMVIPTDWASTLKSAGGSMTYTRDALALPSAITWLGSCSNNAYSDKSSCEGASATWTAARTDYSTNPPAPYGALFAIQEDVMIREFARFSSQSSAGQDMSSHNTLEKAFADALDSIAGNISGTTDGSTAITTTEKKALAGLMKSPQF